VPFTNGVDVASAVPPLDAAYHCIAVPVAVRFATVGEVPEQNDCAAVPVGAAGVVFTVAVTSNRDVLSHVLTVWLAK
jgi:hypothetical protein